MELFMEIGTARKGCGDVQGYRVWINLVAKVECGSDSGVWRMDCLEVLMRSAFASLRRLSILALGPAAYSAHLTPRRPQVRARLVIP